MKISFCGNEYIFEKGKYVMASYILVADIVEKIYPLYAMLADQHKEDTFIQAWKS